MSISQAEFSKVYLLCIEKFDATVWNTKTNLHCIFHVDDAVGTRVTSVAINALS